MNQTDHHFSKKLRDLEIAPSERANELFQSRLEQISPQKQSPAKYFATAAAVLVALGFLLFLHLNKDVMTTDTALVLPKPTETGTSGVSDAGTKATGVPATGTPAAGTQTAGTPATGTPAAEPLPAATHAPGAVSERLSSASEPERMASIRTSKSTTASQNITEKETNRVAEAPYRKSLSDLQSLSPEISYRYHSTDLTDFAILDTHSRLELEAQEASSREVSERSMPLLAKVVREVKYVANGEKPDLDRSGIKPAATALAQNQNGLLANESRQIKEGIHRFKEIFR